MNCSHCRVTLLAAWAAPLLALLLSNCSSSGGGGGSDAAAEAATGVDASAHDGSSAEASEGSAPETGVDAGNPDAPGASEGGDAAPSDATSDASGASDAMNDGGDASDASADSPVGIPCSVEAGEGGDEAGGACPLGQVCCGGWCTDTRKDPANCGACGNACSMSQFCTGKTCDDAVLKNVCANPKATVVHERSPADNQTGDALGASLSAGCMPAVMLMATDVDGGTAQDPATGRPITGPGDTLIAGGGDYLQTSVAYMEKALTPIVTAADGTKVWAYRRGMSTNIVSVPSSMLTDSHDYFVLELSVEPMSGSLCFFGFGFGAPGTTAAGFYFQNDVMPMLSTYGDAWYLYEWTDTDTSGAPSAGDTFTLVDHGT